MYSSQVLKQLLELKQTYKQQNFKFNVAQKEKYQELLQQRRAIVKGWYDTKRVYTPTVGSAKTTK
tara:strand:- start:5 stop:199 length:195 start_codon:yes stop_codon:yes gene_type:complete